MAASKAGLGGYARQTDSGRIQFVFSGALLLHVQGIEDGPRMPQ